MFKNLNNIDIFKALDSLGIKHQSKPNNRGWIPIICIFHSDKNFGNASINVNSGVISCYRCGVSKNISTLLKERNSNYTYIPQTNYQPEIKKEVKKSTNIDSKLIYRFIHKEIDNPEDFYYLKQRGFTKEFCKEFKIVRSFTDPYCDYFCYPIIDKDKNIYQTEFRKLMQMEYLQKYYKCYDLSYHQLTEQFKQQCEKENIRIADYKLYKGNNIIEDKTLFYLLDKKVKYESGSQIKNTIWNINNLNFNEVLWLTEGIGSMSRIWSYISKNCSCTFGSQILQPQIEYLKKFVQVNLVVDQDAAGLKMASTLYSELKNLFVVDIPYEDTHEEYVESIKNCILKTPMQYTSKSMILSKVKMAK